MYMRFTPTAKNRIWTVLLDGTEAIARVKVPQAGRCTLTQLRPLTPIERESIAAFALQVREGLFGAAA